MGTIVSRFLLDTYALLWWLDGDERLGSKARAVIENPENHIYVSAVSAWEIETKFRIGKLPLATGIIGNLESVIEDQGFFRYQFQWLMRRKLERCRDRTVIPSTGCLSPRPSLRK